MSHLQVMVETQLTARKTIIVGRNLDHFIDHGGSIVPGKLIGAVIEKRRQNTHSEKNIAKNKFMKSRPTTRNEKKMNIYEISKRRSRVLPELAAECGKECLVSLPVCCSSMIEKEDVETGIGQDECWIFLILSSALARIWGGLR